MSYTQLTQEQRYQISALLKTKHKQAEIAAEVGVDPSTISRELRRNRGKKGYRPNQAHEKALARRSHGHARISPKTWAWVESRVREEWSPEQIAGRLKAEKAEPVSVEWIYQHILKDKRTGGTLYRHLRCQKRYRKRFGGRDSRGILPNRRSIDQRPALANQRRRLGDWEADTMVGHGSRAGLLTLVDRKSRLTRMARLTRRTAKAVDRQTVRLLREDPAHSITSDNGKEFARHQQIARRLHLSFFFAHPYHAWERGTNENTNGLLRQYFPKTRDFATITPKELRAAASRLNSRPRKCLGFRTPLEVFHHQSVALVT
jgi:transposase, IS30 family